MRKTKKKSDKKSKLRAEKKAKKKSKKKAKNKAKKKANNTDDKKAEQKADQKSKRRAEKKAKRKAKSKATLKTQPTQVSVSAFLAALSDDRQREEAKAIASLMEKATGASPKMWGPSIVGYGDWEYHYASGRSGDWFELGFSPRKKKLALYLLDSGAEFEPLLSRLGPHTRGKGCLYIKTLEDIDVGVLEEIMVAAVAARRGSV